MSQTLYAVCFLEPVKCGYLVLYTLKNPTYPEVVANFKCGAMSLDFHPKHSKYVAVGLHDGTVRVFNLSKRKLKRHVSINSPTHNKHIGHVWKNCSEGEDLIHRRSASPETTLIFPDLTFGIRSKSAEQQVIWVDDHRDKQLGFFSAGSDGRIFKWILLKTDLMQSPVITLSMDDREILMGNVVQPLKGNQLIGPYFFRENLTGARSSSTIKICNKKYNVPFEKQKLDAVSRDTGV
uniref:Uncharacterized protein n=1 Tax=Rhodnius prolixus TaxID=13249 RepID=T1I4P7_RHOPR